MFIAHRISRSRGVESSATREIHLSGRSVFKEAAMIKYCGFALLLCVFLLPAASLQAQTSTSDTCSNPAAVSKMVNPVRPTAESLAQGKKYYGYDCAMCHGQSGNGKGEVDTGEKLPDFSNAAGMKDMSDG